LACEDVKRHVGKYEDLSNKRRLNGSANNAINKLAIEEIKF
jgi:hypothetical protein